MSKTFHHEKKFKKTLSWKVGERKRDKDYGKTKTKSEKISKIRLKESLDN